MSTKDLKGKSVRCVAVNPKYHGEIFTVGKLYPIKAVAGEVDSACGGTVGDDGYVLTCNFGVDTYHCYGRTDAHGVFEVVE